MHSSRIGIGRCGTGGIVVFIIGLFWCSFLDFLRREPPLLTSAHYLHYPCEQIRRSTLIVDLAPGGALAAYRLPTGLYLSVLTVSLATNDPKNKNESQRQRVSRRSLTYTWLIRVQAKRQI